MSPTSAPVKLHPGPEICGSPTFRIELPDGRTTWLLDAGEVLAFLSAWLNDAKLPYIRTEGCAQPMPTPRHG